jgi:sugar lactone lactonase YvrE
MQRYELKTLVKGGGFYEGLRWHDGRWWVSDMQRCAVLSVATDGKEELVASFPTRSSGIGWLPDGSMLIVSMKNHRLMRRLASGMVEEYADLSIYRQGDLNDMVVNKSGHAYIGQFGFDLEACAKPKKTTLLMVAPNRSVAVVADDLFCPNGMVITPDGSTLIVGEALGGCYTAFDIGGDGRLSGRRLWAELGPMPVLGEYAETMAQLKATPDGCCLDAKGGIWVADPIGRRCARVLEGGRITDEIPAPEGFYFWACMLGGEDGKTLLISCAPGFLDHGRGAGTLLTARVSVSHAGLP